MCKQDAGKYMTKAVNDAGETQSIADFIILEPTPERMTDIAKTVALENIDQHRVRIFFCMCILYRFVGGNRKEKKINPNE